ncbi:MAG: ABC transporter substrate-binding protein [Verrucomicrobiales bacterium]|nr:ABC transporter substrate-binding protein [Verrucomicrobiales bacterium]
MWCHCTRAARVVGLDWAVGFRWLIVIFQLVAWPLTSPAAPPVQVIRIGHFPNITHAQALIARAMAREAKPWFEPRLGEGVQLEWYAYNAGPSAMEALLSRSIDLSYVGVSPTLNAYARTAGKEVRVVAGACSGGAALVVHPESGIRSAADLRGKQLGTPQLGNTQDIAARSWLISQGLKVTLTGGDLLVVPSGNADLFALFKKHELDAVWTVEPWVSRLVHEAQGRVLFEEASLWKATSGRYCTTHLVSSVRFLNEQAQLLTRFLEAHLDLTLWISQNPKEAKRLLNDELKAETKRGIAPEIMDAAWPRLEFTVDPIKPSLHKAVQDMHEVGFYRKASDFSRIYALTPMNEILRKRNQTPIPE